MMSAATSVRSLWPDPSMRPELLPFHGLVVDVDVIDQAGEESIGGRSLTSTPWVTQRGLQGGTTGMRFHVAEIERHPKAGGSSPNGS